MTWEGWQLWPCGSNRPTVCRYPFHPPAKLQQLRTAHLEHLRTLALICQCTRDRFGRRDELASYNLSPSIEVLWLEDGDHDLNRRLNVRGASFDRLIISSTGLPIEKFVTSHSSAF
jgi:predicted alpha/beta-hydrolase family hydrolase